MESQICSMCQRPKATPLSNSGETDRNVEELLGHFEMPAGLFRGSKFCPDCLKLLALTHQVSVKIRKRKQAQEQEQGKSPAAAGPVDPGRRPSNEATKLSLAKRMRLAQAAFDDWKEKERSFDASSAASANGSDDKHESESESAVEKYAAAISRSDDEEYRGESGECSSSFRSRTRSL